MNFVSPRNVPKPFSTKQFFQPRDAPLENASILTRSVSSLRKRLPAKRMSDFTYDSSFFDESLDQAVSASPTPLTTPIIDTKPLGVLTQATDDSLEDKLDTSIPTGIFDTVVPSGPSQQPEKPVSSPPPEASKSASTQGKQSTETKKNQRRVRWDRSFANNGTSFVTPFITFSVSLPTQFLNFVEGIPWGPDKIQFQLSSQIVWEEHQSFETISEILHLKDIIPFSIVWLPFFAEILDFALKRLFRISFSSYASTLIICPFVDESKYLPFFRDNPKHGSILLTQPVNFCAFPCILICLNFKTARHISVTNNQFGIFATNSFSRDFVPLKSQSIISHVSDPNSSNFIPLVQNKLSEAFELEQTRLDSRFQCPKFPALKVNNFVKPTYDFDVTSVEFHYSSPHLLRKYFPPELFPKPKRKLAISYQKYNEMCGDDTKITQNSIPSEQLFCSLCGKFGHENSFCWMRVRSSKELGLTSPTDLALNAFLLNSTRAPSFPRMRPTDCIINFVTTLLLQIHSRAFDFTTAWEHFALSHNVSSNLIEPGFSQLRQGLAYWYAISCPIYVLQWIAFGIPVFWQSNARPPTFEVKPTCRHGAFEDSSPTTLKAVQKFLDMSFLLPITRDQAHCCAPLFDRESSGKMRSIHDLRLVNRYIMAISFTLFTAFNFCALAVAGSVFIITDFSSCWHQLRHLIKDMRFFAFRTIENGHPKYWLPTGKTFGESDVPFAITHLVSFITCLFNLFTLCSFWIDDGIIKVGNIHDSNWTEVASCIRSFTAELFSVLCLLINHKCDFQPSVEKPWVGLWNTAEGTFIKAAKLQKFGEIILDVLSKGTLSLSQAETLGGKINSFGLGLDMSFELKILNSFLKCVSRILGPTRDSNPKLPISENFGIWILNIFDILLQSLTPKRSQLELSDLPLVIVACDASNIGNGLVISYQDKIIFETAMPLPLALSFHSELSELESSSTDVERFAFETLALKTAKQFLEGFFPNTVIQLKILTDNLPLAIQLNTGKLRSFRAICDASAIFTFLKSWGMPYTISYHSRESSLGKLADACTRYFIPVLRPPHLKIFKKLTSHQAFSHLNITEALLNAANYFSDTKNIIVPLNLPTTLYAKLFPLISSHYKASFIFCPKITAFQSLLSSKFTLKFEFQPSCFLRHPHAFKTLPYLLFEFSPTPSQRDDLPKSTSNMAKFAYGAEMRLHRQQEALTQLLVPGKVNDMTSRQNMEFKPLVTPPW